MELKPGDVEPQKQPTLGFIGVGTLTSAIVTGLCSVLSAAPSAPFSFSQILLSPRNEKKARELKQKYPDSVTVVASNQEVVDSSDWLFLVVRPQIAAAVLKDLVFKKGQKIISLMAVVKTETIADYLIGKSAGNDADETKTTKIIRAVPLPPVAKRQGVTCMWPADTEVEALFNYLGTVCVLEKEEGLTTLMSVSCLMGPYYEQLRHVAGWCVNHGIPDAISAKYCTGVFRSISLDAAAAGEERGCDGLTDLVAEQTPGGLNEAAIADLTKGGVYSKYITTLDLTLQRLRGVVSLKTD